MNKKELLFLKLSINTKVPIKNEKFSDERNLKKIILFCSLYYIEFMFLNNNN